MKTTIEAHINAKIIKNALHQPINPTIMYEFTVGDRQAHKKKNAIRLLFIRISYE